MSRQALDMRLGRVVDRLARAGGLGFPAGPVEGWPEAELRRLGRMVEAGGALQRAALARLTDADLQWMAASDDCSHVEANEAAAAAGGVGPGGRAGPRPWLRVSEER